MFGRATITLGIGPHSSFVIAQWRHRHSPVGRFTLWQLIAVITAIEYLIYTLARFGSTTCDYSADFGKNLESLAGVASLRLQHCARRSR